VTLDSTPLAATREAIIAILQMALVSDGSVKPFEDEALLSALKRSRNLACLNERELRALEARVAAGLAETTLADAASQVPEHLRLPLFAQAIDILLADGELSGGEADFVNGLILSLNIDRKDAEPVLDVLATKNRL
jgi:uncharacterized tellurite resistance protein B-like protein